ncbi:MAG TPA: hypothetical protein VE714_04405, partial [Gemmatimonadales bacterium]|nr:hypothetical protein [Gemmatimonadales bacterium]
MCSAHATVRGLLGELLGGTGNGRDVVLDLEAGLEHLSRGTARYASHVFVIVEPYFRSLETGRRVKELAAELGIQHVEAIANKIRDAEDRRSISEFCTAAGLPLAVEIAYDATLVAAERAGAAPVDFDAASPLVAALAQLAARVAAA